MMLSGDPPDQEVKARIKFMSEQVIEPNGKD